MITKGLGACFNNFGNVIKSCQLVHSAHWYIYAYRCMQYVMYVHCNLYMASETTWNLVDKEGAIPACARGQMGVNITRDFIVLCDLLTFYQALGVNLSFTLCSTLGDEGACTRC